MFVHSPSITQLPCSFAAAVHESGWASHENILSSRNDNILDFRFPGFPSHCQPEPAKRKSRSWWLEIEDDACIVVIYLRSDGVGYRFFARSRVGARAAGRVGMHALSGRWRRA
jgi:hypothetical protein